MLLFSININTYFLHVLSVFFHFLSYFFSFYHIMLEELSAFILLFHRLIFTENSAVSLFMYCITQTFITTILINSCIYLGLSKSSGPCILISYRRFKKNFFFYEQIERRLLYFSMLFDCYLTDIIIINFR
jgi:hypothetical protein